MNRMNIFENEEFGRIRVIEINKEPWFVGKDIAEALGYENTKDAIKKHVDEEDKQLFLRSQIATLENHIPKSALSIEFVYEDIPNRGLTIINESGLYSLILSSKLPNAKKFKRWITSEILPSIRKHGAYLTTDTLNKMIRSPEFGIKLLTELKKEQDLRKFLEIENEQKNMVIEEYKPKVTYYDIVLQSKDLVSITQIAKDYGKSAQWLNNFLHKKGVQYKQGGIWLPYQKYADQGYTRSKTNIYADEAGIPHSRLHTYWTQKGRWFIYRLLAKEGILPIIEWQA